MLKFIQKIRASRQEKAATLAREVQRLIVASTPDFAFNPFVFGNEKNYLDYIKAYNGWVYACASKNASAIASMPLRLYAAVPEGKSVKYLVKHKPVDRKTKAHLMTKSHLGPLLNNATDVEEITEHIFLDLIRSMNPIHNGFEALETLGLSLDLTGNGYWRLVLDPSNGIPLEIWPLMPQYVTIMRSKTLGIEAYKYGLDDRTADIIPADEVVHFRYPNPKDYFYGMGPMEAAQLPAALNQKFDVYEHSVLDNNAVIPFFLGTDQTLNESTVSRLRNDVEKLHKGYKKAGKMGFFHSGLKPHKLAVDPTDVNYVEGHRITLEKIAAIFGVPMSMLKSDKVPRANADAGAYQHAKHTINPRLHRIEQTINQDIMPLYDQKLFVAFDNPVPEDKDFELKESDTRLKNWSLTINEYRQKHGEDEVEWGNEPLVQGQVVPLSESAPKPQTVEMPPLPDEDPNEDESKHVCKSQSPKESREIIAQTSKWINSTAFVIAGSVSSIDVTSADSVITNIPWREIEETGKDLLEADLSTTLHSGALKGAQRMKQVGVSISWDIHNPHAEKWAREYVGRKITVINEQTRQAVRETVAESIRNGQALRGTRQSIQAIIKDDLKGMAGLNRSQAKALANFKDKLRSQGFSDRVVFDAGREYRAKLLKQRAELIARTETAAAWAEGNIAAYREAGLHQKEFSSAGDACPICSHLNGKIYNIGDDSVSIPVHPNCRCDWLPVTEV